MPLSLQQLHTFRVVARHLSFSAAARELFATQPHVSNQIKAIEEHFRVPLFVRSRAGISLTEAGHELYTRTANVLDDLRDAERAVGEFRELRRGSVRLAATSSIGNHLLPHLIADFRSARPELSVVGLVGNTERVWELVENDEAELALTTYAAPASRRLVAEPFLSDPLVVVAPPELDVPDEFTPADVASYPLVLREDGSLTLEVLRQFVEGHEVTVAAQLSGTAAVNEAVAAGLGISLVPESSVEAWTQARSIVVRPTSSHSGDLRHDYVLVHAPGRFQTRAAEALLSHLRAWGHARRTDT